MLSLILSGLVNELDKAIKAGADLMQLTSDKHYKAALWLIKWYKPELDALADKSDTTFDDKVVDELYQVAVQAWPD